MSASSCHHNRSNNAGEGENIFQSESMTKSPLQRKIWVIDMLLFKLFLTILNIGS